MCTTDPHMKLTERANDGLHAHVIDQVLKTLPERGADILDVGCGTGALLAQLRDHGYRQLTGLDISPPADVAGIRFHAVDLDGPTLPVADQSVDLALAVEVIEHLENPGAFLAGIRSKLRPSGQLLITTPNVHSVEARVRWLLLGKLKQFDPLGDPTHLYPVFGFAFARLLKRCGLTVRNSWGFPLDGSSPTSRRGLRALAGIARAVGATGSPDGDQLCMLLACTQDHRTACLDDKIASVTSHY